MAGPWAPASFSTGNRWLWGDGAATGLIKVWMDPDWVKKPVKVWIGSGWAVYPMKFLGTGGYRRTA